MQPETRYARLGDLHLAYQVLGEGPPDLPCSTSGSATSRRIATLAGPREILVSSTVRDLVVGSGLEFDERGEHELKGVPGTWRVFSVRL